MERSAFFNVKPWILITGFFVTGVFGTATGTGIVHTAIRATHFALGSSYGEFNAAVHHITCIGIDEVRVLATPVQDETISCDTVLGSQVINGSLGTIIRKYIVVAISGQAVGMTIGYHPDIRV